MRIVYQSSIPLIEELFSGHGWVLTPEQCINSTSLQKADVLICRSTVKVNEALLQQSPVKIVATATSGTCHIDLPYLAARNTQLLDAKGANAKSVCDYVLSVLGHQFQSLEGLSLGIIGVGEVGSRLVKQARALGLTVYPFDPPREKREPGFHSASLKKIQQCQIVSLHVPLTVEGKNKTQQLVDNEFLKALPDNTLLINTARGEIVDETALLNHQRPLRLALDVFNSEPAINSKLLAKATIATPHIAGHAIEAKWRASLMLYRKLCKSLDIPYKSSQFDRLLDEEHKNFSHQALKKHYNPLGETDLLKQSLTASKFTQLRRSHHRHEL